MEEVSEEYKKRLRDKFERAAIKGKWLMFGGKIVIGREKPKIGRENLVRATVILEEVSEI